MPDRRRLLIANSQQSELPSGYTRLNYLENTGTAYIDTLIGLSPTDSIRIVFGYPSAYPSSENYMYLFGAQQYGIRTPSLTSIRGGIGTGNWVTTNVNPEVRNTIFMKKSASTFNGNSITVGEGNNPQSNCFLFRTQNTTRGYFKIYSFEHYLNDQLVQKLIPALDSSNIPCMYDTVSRQTFYNAGTGDFLYG